MCAYGCRQPVEHEALVRFGQTDLHVTRYCQGTAFRAVPHSDNPEALAILQRCLDVGINFEAYGWGGSERALGRAIAGHRDKVVICTKAAPSLTPERGPRDEHIQARPTSGPQS